MGCQSGLGQIFKKNTKTVFEVLAPAKDGFKRIILMILN
jgi:hypothetical protein